MTAIRWWTACLVLLLSWPRIRAQLIPGFIKEGQALELFLNNTWPVNTFTPDTTCNWNPHRVSCNNANNVVSVNLSGLALNGTIPPGSIANLTELQVLDLSNNMLTGTLPSDIENLSKLTKINVSHNSLSSGSTGGIPAFVKTFSALVELDFSYNKMSGSVAADLRNLTSLEVFILSSNKFSGSLSQMTLPDNLTTLDLSSNAMGGNISVDFFQNLTELKVLRLGGNGFGGQLSAVSFPGNLTELDLSNNKFDGLVPPSFFTMGGLEHLSLGSNQLSGYINMTLPAALLVLDLHSNNFIGPLPTLNGKLQELYLYQNSLEGPVPPIPSNLVIFDVHENRLAANVSEVVRSANTSLTYLDLCGNHFALQKFPENFSHLENLVRLGLADNNFYSHSFPALPGGKTLLRLNLSRTNLSGIIPDVIVDDGKLGWLDLSRNELSGRIPPALGMLNELELLNLSYNKISGSIPVELENLTFLSKFDVSFNNLSGEIPHGNQFSTFENSSYQGNPYLCGVPLAVCKATQTNSSTLSSARSSSSRSTAPVIAGIVTGIAAIIVFAGTLFVWCRVSRAVKPLAKDDARHVSGPMLYEKDAETWATGVKEPSTISVVMFQKPLLNISFSDLVQATCNFSKEMQIADGGYGPVYKGILVDGSQIAIKVLVEVGFSDEKEAAARIEALAKVKHPNLVSLAGYCVVGVDSVVLYDYMVNGDLQRWLHELPEGTRNPDDFSRDTWEQLDSAEVTGDYLSWPMRHRIALGTARALAFLHHGCSPHVIHRDVKSSNILLDEAFEPHLVDCGLAGIARMNGTPVIGGTLGYVPPEYGQTWQATTRGDVYSFGVVLLELVTGRKPTGHYFHDSYGGNLVGWVRSMIKQDKRGQKALDPKLASKGYVSEMLETLRIGYLCTAETPAKRPTMQQVVGLLKDCQSGTFR